MRKIIESIAEGLILSLMYITSQSEIKPCRCLAGIIWSSVITTE